MDCPSLSTFKNLMYLHVRIEDYKRSTGSGWDERGSIIAFETVDAGLVETVRGIMGNDPAHGWPHVVRVHGISLRIVEEGRLEPDIRVLEHAVLLHDVGRFLEGKGHHAVKSASFARRVLEGVDESFIEAVVHAILTHSYSLGVRAGTLEAMILSDADKIDALGAVGIARVFHTGCLLGRGFEDSLGHFREKILRLPGLLYLEASRRIARERARIVEEYVERLAEELGVG